MPQEVINDVMRYSACHDFMKEFAQMYPKTIFFRIGREYVEVDTKAAFCFAAIRKKLLKAWDITIGGPKIDSEVSEGLEKRPLDISDLGVALSDFKLITMLLNDNEHKKVLNLTDEQVQRLDEGTQKLMMDTYRWLYIGRTRIGNQTGGQIEATFHGTDCVAKYGIDMFPIDEGFNREWDFINKKDDVFATALELKLPENMTWATFHKFAFAVPQGNDTVLSIMAFQKETSFRGFNLMYQSSYEDTMQTDLFNLS